METVTARCIDCEQSFFYTRQYGVYGHKRQRCEICAVKRERKLTRDRVRKHRSNAKLVDTYTYHLRGCNGKAICGREMKGHDMAEFLRDDAHNGKVAKLCKACDRILFRRLKKDDGE